jgi:DNA-binding response OmpR family regulator
MAMAKGRILVVDDEVYIVHILDFSLGMEGYEVITALDGEQALEKARAEQPDLIVLDVMMPKLDGYETCRILADDATRTSVILLSAKDATDQKIGPTSAPTTTSRSPSPRKLVERINAIIGEGNSGAWPDPAGVAHPRQALTRARRPRGPGAWPPPRDLPPPPAPAISPTWTPRGAGDPPWNA